jgi:hypothetical protein
LWLQEVCPGPHPSPLQGAQNVPDTHGIICLLEGTAQGAPCGFSTHPGREGDKITVL